MINPFQDMTRKEVDRFIHKHNKNPHRLTTMFRCRKCGAILEAHKGMAIYAKRMGSLCGECNPKLLYMNARRKPAITKTKEDGKMTKTKKNTITTPQKKKGSDGIEFIHVPDSIKVTKSVKDDFAWDIKIYFDSQGGKSSHKEVIEKITDIHNDLIETFEEEE